MRFETVAWRPLAFQLPIRNCDTTMGGQFTEWVTSIVSSRLSSRDLEAELPPLRQYSGSWFRTLTAMRSSRDGSSIERGSLVDTCMNPHPS
jgi:hypothetical protein